MTDSEVANSHVGNDYTTASYRLPNFDIKRL